MKVLLDTDVVLDFILQREPFYSDAKEIFVRSAQEDFLSFISAITPLNVSYIARKEFGNDKTRLEISNLLKLVNICRIDYRILQNALVSDISDYEDAVQNESAIAEKLDAIITRNTKDFNNSTLKIYTPGEFLQII